MSQKKQSKKQKQKPEDNRQLPLQFLKMLIFPKTF